MKKEPSYVLAHIIDKRHNESIDNVVYDFGRVPSKKGFITKRTKDQLERIILNGENENVEFKQDLQERSFLETVIAFSNTSGGLLFLGVGDNGQITGFQEESDRITNLITSNIDPTIKVQINRLKMKEKPIVLIEVPEGENKPYTHRELGTYIRKNATNRRATRTDLDAIYSEMKQSGYPYPDGM